MDGGHEGRVVAVESADSLNEKRTDAQGFFGGVWKVLFNKITTGVAGGAFIGAAPAIVTGQPAYMAIGAGVGGILGARASMSKHNSWKLSKRSS